MKSLCVLLVCLPILAMAQEKEEKSSVTESAKSVVSSIVKFGKEVISGASDGVTEGRKTGESDDGAVIVSNLAELEQHLIVKVLGKTATSENRVTIELGFKNNGAKPIRIINLKDNNAVIVIDDEGYATGLTLTHDNPFEITIPEQAAIKQTFSFAVAQDKVSAIRIWGKQYSLNR